MGREGGRHVNYAIDSDIDEILDRLGDDGKAFEDASVVGSGFAGFLGRYFVEIFKRLGAAHIVVLDNMITAGPMSESLKNDPAVRFIETDVSTLPNPDILTFGELGGVSHVIHAAALTSPFYYHKYPLETLDASIAGTRNMLALAKEKGGRFLLTSTSEMYGDPLVVPTPETYRGNVAVDGMRSPYDEGKRVAETIAYIYHVHFDVPAVTVRIFNAYGPGMDERDYRCMPNFAARLKAGKPLQVYATGKQTRTFSYVTDIVVGCLQALARGKSGEAYNIGNPAPEISILELAKMMIRMSPKGGAVEIVPHPDSYPGDEPQRRCPDIAKAQRDFGFNPIVPLGEGLRRFLGWAMVEYKGE